MAMREQQERRSPPVETTHTASDEPELVPKSGPTAGGSAATAGDMAGSAAAGEEERGPEGAGLGLDIVGSPSAWSALLSAAGSTNQVEICSILAGPWFQRRPRTHVSRAAAPSPHWLGFRLPVLPVPPAPPVKRKGGRAKKPRDTPCALCGAAETPLWRTWPTDWRVPLCNACGIQVRTLPPGAVLPELVYLPHPATATAVAELEQPVVAPAQETQQPAALPKQVRVNLTPPAMAATTVVVPELEPPRPQEIQEPEPEPEPEFPPDSPILESLLDADIYLVKRTSPRRREKSPSPPPPPPTAAEPEPDAAAPAPGNENAKQPERRCLHCGATSTRQWRLGPEGEKTLCNPCGVRYRQGGLVPEYRPRESPSFNASVHSNERRAVLQIRRNLAHPAPPAAYQPVRARRKRRRGDGEGQQQRVQVGKKRKEEEQYQPAAAVALPVREKSKRIKAMEQRRQQPPQPEAAATQLRAGNDMLLNLDLDLDLDLNLPPPLPPALPNTGGGMEVDGHLPPELPQHTAGNMEMEEQDLPPPSSSPPLALPLAGGERMRDEEGPMPAPEPFLFDGPAAPIIVDDDDDEPVEVIVIDDD